MWIQLSGCLGFPSYSLLPLWLPSPTLLSSALGPASSSTRLQAPCRQALGFSNLSISDVSCNAWHRTGISSECGKHGVIWVYQDREKIPTQHGGSPTASPLEYFSVLPPATSQHKSSIVNVLCTCHRPPSNSLLLLFPSESCSPFGAFLKPQPFPHLMQTLLITRTFLSLVGHPCGPCHKVPSATTSKLAHLLPTGHEQKSSHVALSLESNPSSTTTSDIHGLG